MEHLQGQLPLVIGGQKRTLFFDYTFASILSKLATGPELDKMDQFELLPVLAYAALKAGDDVNNLPDDLSVRMVGRWLMQLTPADNATVLSQYQHAMGFMLQSLSLTAEAAKAAANPPKSKPKASL